LPGSERVAACGGGFVGLRPASAPAFATVASMPAPTAEFLNAFLQSPDATMPTWFSGRLTEATRSAVFSAYARKGAVFILVDGFAPFKAD
jgi:hypothetical protein